MDPDPFFSFSLFLVQEAIRIACRHRRRLRVGDPALANTVRGTQSALDRGIDAQRWIGRI